MNDDEKRNIRQELDRLRNQGARRRDLSLHACKRLFLDYGVRPSLASVRDLTGVGSASDIPKDIEMFWERLRESSRVRIDSGALPANLHEKAGEFLSGLYDAAVASARTELNGEREAMEQRIAEADQRARDARMLYDNLNAELAKHIAARTASALKEGETVERLATERAVATQARDRLVTVETRLAESQRDTAALQERLDKLQDELRERTERYASEIKDAISNAERRVKPLLVELDALRTAASSYQTGLRDQNRKEFEHIQQLAAVKARADTLQNRVDEQVDEIDHLSRRVHALQSQAGVPAAIGKLVVSMAASGRLTNDEIASIGNLVDGHVELPIQCPGCAAGEPELYQRDGRYELQCPDCERSSGSAESRFAAMSRFVASPMPATRE
jgi:chaperonin cofactor prefoldin